MFFETKKGKYSEEENEIIINAINQGIQEGRKERDILKELSDKLNRGYAGVMSHVRKLRSEFPHRFISSEDSGASSRQGAWEEWEEELVISTVNRYLKEGKSLSAAISELENKLPRTQGAIYQRIYTLRRKKPEKFEVLPESRPRKRRKLPEWHTRHPVIRSLDAPIEEVAGAMDWNRTAMNQLAVAVEHSRTMMHEQGMTTNQANSEEELLLKAFEERYGRPNPTIREKLLSLMRTYGPTHVSIAMFTLSQDKGFPGVVADYLEKKLERKNFV
ncbi:hypothetical protein [Staphylospora marina]|uniref:hypothetical protein n=1 Tax=Staphylospora marina TaxID=2490858 RepID=UPI000F5B9E74|nr:hypothetical protein [Staphylospora marina]